MSFFQKISYRTILVYLLLLVFSYLLFAFAWYGWVDGVLFYNSDKVAFLDFKPPFNHGSLNGDYWIASKDTVYSMWYLFWLGVVSVPVLILGLVSKKKKVIGFTVAVIILGVMVFIANEFKNTTSAPPKPPLPLTNSEAVYRIVKLGENFAISYQERDKKEEQIIYVGNSRARLGECVNCEVRIDGDYHLYEGSGLCVDTNTQCIAEECHDIFKRGQPKLSTCAVDIHSVEILPTGILPTNENLGVIPSDYLDADEGYYYLPGMRFRVGKELVRQRLMSTTKTPDFPKISGIYRF